MPRTVPWNDSHIENHIKWSYRVVVHEPKNRSRESSATKVDVRDCPWLSRTVNPVFLAQHDVGFEIKDQGTGAVLLWSYCSGALVFNFKFFQKAFAGRPWRPNFFLLLSPSLLSFLPLSLFLCARQYRTVQAGTWTCKMQLGAYIWMFVTFRILRSVFHILRYARQYISNLWDSMLILYYFAALACK